MDKAKAVVDNPLYKLIAEWAKWLIIAAGALALYAGKAWMADFVAHQPVVADTRARVLEVEERSAALVVQNAAVVKGQDRVAAALEDLSSGQRQIATQVAVLGQKVDQSETQRQADVKRLDGRLDQLRK